MCQKIKRRKEGGGREVNKRVLPPALPHIFAPHTWHLTSLSHSHVQFPAFGLHPHPLSQPLDRPAIGGNAIGGDNVADPWNLPRNRVLWEAVACVEWCDGGCVRDGWLQESVRG